MGSVIKNAVLIKFSLGPQLLALESSPAMSSGPVALTDFICFITSLTSVVLTGRTVPNVDSVVEKGRLTSLSVEICLMKIMPSCSRNIFCWRVKKFGASVKMCLLALGV